MRNRTPRHAAPLTVAQVDQELEAWAAAGFPIPHDTEAPTRDAGCSTPGATGHQTQQQTRNPIPIRYPGTATPNRGASKMRHCPHCGHHHRADPTPRCGAYTTDHTGFHKCCCTANHKNTRRQHEASDGNGKMRSWNLRALGESS